MTLVSSTDRQRAVSVVIGVMLMMSVLFIAAAQYQLVIVPQQEETTEANHFRTVSSQMNELRTDILTASSNGAHSSQKLNMGTEYSRDLIFGILPEVHAANPSGRIANRDYSGSQLEIRNVEGIGSASNYWPGVGNPCDDPNHCFDTTSFHYKPTYNQLDDPPQIIYENSVLYDFYGDGDGTYEAPSTSDDEYVIHTDQSMVKGRTVNLIAVTGDLQQSRVGPMTIDSVPVSAPAQSISIQSNGSGPVTFVIPTRLPTEVWRCEILANEIRNNPCNGNTNADGYIDSVSDGPTPSTIQIQMLAGETYNLKLSRVHLTSRQERSNVPIAKAAYVAWKGNEKVTIRENATTEINAQVRDRYNNPVLGVQTQAHARDANDNCIGDFRSATASCPGGQQQPAELTSGEDGLVTYYYEAPDVDSDTTITFQIELNDPDMTYSPKMTQPVVPRAPMSDDTDSDTILLSSTEDDEEPTNANVNQHPDPRAPALGGPDFPFSPKLHSGFLNPDNTVRVVDFQLANLSTSFGQPVRATVLVDNTGHQQETVTLQPDSDRAISTTPGSYQVTLDPGERKRIGFKIRFKEAGTHVLDINGVAGYTVNVRPARDDVVPATIKNRIDKENIEKPPSVFKDGDAIPNEYQESQNIPPVTYDPATGTYKDNAAGNLFKFTYIGADDGNYTEVHANPSKAVSNSLRVGFATNYIPDNDVYTLFINYSFTGSTNYVELSNVNTTGVQTDDQSAYHLSNDAPGFETQRAFQLTPQEGAALRRSNSHYLTLHTPNGGHPSLNIDRMWLVSSESVLKLTEANISVDPTSVQTTRTTVDVGEAYTLSADLLNDKNSVGKKRVKLFEDQDGDGTYEAVRATDAYVNPGPQGRKTVAFTLYKKDPGTYSYKFGVEDTPDSNAVTVTVED